MSNRRLKKYIKRALRKGKTKEYLMNVLLTMGYQQTYLDQIFSDMGKPKFVEINIPKRKEAVDEPQLKSTPDEKETKIGLTSQVRELKENMDFILQKGKAEKKFKKKKFRMPFKIKSKLKKLAVKDKVLVMLLQATKNIKPTIGELKDGMLIVGNESIHCGSVDFTWLWNGKTPTVILPEWDLQPIRAEALYKDAVEGKRLADPQKIIIRSMEYKEALQPKKLSGKAIIWILIAGVIVFYVLFAQGK